MASIPQLDDDDDFGGDFAGNRNPKRTKRTFGDLEDEEDDFFGSEKGNTKVEETAPGAATGMILILRESLKTCEENLATCQTELESAKAEIHKWNSAFRNESFIPHGTIPEPKLVLNYLLSLNSSEESLREQLEKAKKKEAAFIVTFAKRDQEIAEFKCAVRDLRAQLKPPSMQARRLLLDPAIHEEFTRLKNLIEEKDKKVKELQDNFAAVSFTSQSKMGKLLMAKCRTLQEENEEIGNQASEGKIHELAMKLALQKAQNTELQSQFEGLHKHMDGLTTDAEKSNEMLLILQERLEERDAIIQKLKDQLNKKIHMEEEVVEEKEESDLPWDTNESEDVIVSDEPLNCDIIR